jgi:hypothetical protein
VSEFKMGDIVVLTAGSMRMAVEMIENDKVSTVWCNEGVIGRDMFSPVLLKKWEYREEDKTRSPRSTASRGYDKKDSRESARPEKPKGKTGWDGKAREKKFFRKD